MANLHLSTRYPGGFRLTMKTAKELARQEFGTAAGLMRDTDTDLEGYFKMILGHLVVTIRPDIRMSGCIEVRAGMHTANHSCVGYFDPATLEPRYDVRQSRGDSKECCRPTLLFREGGISMTEIEA